MRETSQLYNQAVKAIEGGDPNLAIDRLERILATTPTDRDATLLLAESYRELANAPRTPGVAPIAFAQTLLMAWHGRNPDDFDAALLLADIHLQRGEPGSAAKVLRQILVQEPTNWEAQYLMGNAFSDVGAVKEAVSAYRHSLGVNPFSHDVWYNLAIALERLALGDLAAEAYVSYLKCRPDAPDTEEINALITRLRSAED